MLKHNPAPIVLWEHIQYQGLLPALVVHQEHIQLVLLIHVLLVQLGHIPLFKGLHQLLYATFVPKEHTLVQQVVYALLV
jgi:hypothetical protein